MEFQLTATQLALAIGVFIPALVALVTKSSASASVKQIVNLAISAVAGWFAAATATTPYNLKTVLISIGTTFAFSVASYLGLKTVVAEPIEKATGDFGVG